MFTLECSIDRVCGIIHRPCHLVEILTPLTTWCMLTKIYCAELNTTLFYTILIKHNYLHKNNHQAKVFNIKPHDSSSDCNKHHDVLFGQCMWNRENLPNKPTVWSMSHSRVLSTLFRFLPKLFLNME